jgi:hypothetical protein
MSAGYTSRIMKTMTITTLGAAAFTFPLASGDVPDILVPADIQWPGGKRLDLEGELWRAVLSSTSQPPTFS